MTSLSNQRVEDNLEGQLAHVGNPLQNNAAEISQSKQTDNQVGSLSCKNGRVHSFDQTSFNELLEEYNLSSTAPQALGLTQAFLLTNNIAASATAAALQTPYKSVHDFAAQTHSLTDAMHHVGRLVQQLGPTDRSSNFVLAQKQLMRAQVKEGRDIRQVLNEIPGVATIDGEQYARVQEQIAQAKIKAKTLFDELSDEESQLNGHHQQNDYQNVNSEDKSVQNEAIQKKLQQVIYQIRSASRQFLGLLHPQEYPVSTLYRKLARCKEYRRLRQQKNLNRRNIKEDNKRIQNELQVELKTIYQKLDTNIEQISHLQVNTKSQPQIRQTIETLQKKIEHLQKIVNLESKVQNSVVKTNQVSNQNQNESNTQFNGQPISIAEIDTKALNANSSAIYELLMRTAHPPEGYQKSVFTQYAGKKRFKKDQLAAESLFGRFKRLPGYSALLQGFGKETNNQKSQQGNDLNAVDSSQQQTQSNAQNTQGQFDNNQEVIVRVIGLEPERLFDSLPKYRVDITKMPTFSNTFDSYEKFIKGPNINNQDSKAIQKGAQGVQAEVLASAVDSKQNKETKAGQGQGQTTQSTNVQQAQMQLNEKQIFARQQDGRSVISLPFNPNLIPKDNVNEQTDDTNEFQRRLYQTVIHDFVENREAIIRQTTEQQREKQENAAWKRAWAQIAKRDIPKAHRVYQKTHSDIQTQQQRLATNAQKEVRKKVIKNQRNCKEFQARAKRLTKELLVFWRKRDKELADLKRRKEKIDKEMKKREQELQEQLLQKRRLEYLMKQSEIYAHFMANKMGMNEEVNNENQQQKEIEQQVGLQRVDVDETQARGDMAAMINNDRQRLIEFDGCEDTANNQVQADDLDVNRFDTNNYQQKPIETPLILNATLKEYQLRGLRWLDNLYEQGINGILADEMGLGKTIQAISLMAHIAEAKGTWGPFLVVVPVTTLHNWQNELQRFCPQLRVLPYFGNQEERKKLSKFIDPKNMMNPALQIHVIITSYNLIVNSPKDQAKLMRIKWNYMILDEAQAIKNNLSRRWKVLLNFNARNRLLLTGTPIQNSMAELWALLHFIMPKLFDNHEQFQEWFSKDIEASSMNQCEINKIQLRRLHAILKPFMLRRLKKDVEQEIAPKTEIVVQCVMTYRQRTLYQRIRSKISNKDLMLAQDKHKLENLMNLVMHMRKVCNHPDLFEERAARIPVTFTTLQVGVQRDPVGTSNLKVYCSLKNPINYTVPKLISDELLIVNNLQKPTYSKLLYGEDTSVCQFSSDNHYRFMNIFNPLYLHEQLWQTDAKSKCQKEGDQNGNILKNSFGFSILHFLCTSNSWSLNELCTSMKCDKLITEIMTSKASKQRHLRRTAIFNQQGIIDNDRMIDTGEEFNEQLTKNFYTSYASLQNKSHLSQKLDLCILDLSNIDYQESILFREIAIQSRVDNEITLIPPCIPSHPLDIRYYQPRSITSIQTRLEISKMYMARVVSEAIRLECTNSGTFQRFYQGITQNPNAKRLLLTGTSSSDEFKVSRSLWIQKCNKLPSYLAKEQIDYEAVKVQSLISLPPFKALIQDCGKMQQFAKLIPQLAAGKHRCLVFCQMTRQLDLLEDYLLSQHLSYFRMDGSTQLPDRRYMVEEFQKNDNIFAFLLSTRAGGLGINLIAADTVIFYDNDWNPTMDEQATDRAHRIGQTKPVTVYRLVTKGTVEEKIVKRAQQKQSVQSSVYGVDTFKVRDVQMMLADDINDSPDAQGNVVEEDEAAGGFIKSGRRRGGPRKTKKPVSGAKVSASEQLVKGKTSGKKEMIAVEDSESSDDDEGVVLNLEEDGGKDQVLAQQRAEKQARRKAQGANQANDDEQMIDMDDDEDDDMINADDY